MIFTVFTILSFVAVSAVISVIRFRTVSPGVGYPAWLKRGVLSFLLHPRKITRAVSKRFLGWGAAEYPGWTIWVPGILFASMAYLAISGIGAALFFRNGMSGVFLLSHMGAGAIFALTLALDLFLRARDYGEIPCTVSLPSIVFWIFMGCGILLAGTALGSMTDLFTLRGQLTLIGVHRYAATVLVLAGAARIELAGRK